MAIRTVAGLSSHGRNPMSENHDAVVHDAELGSTSVPSENHEPIVHDADAGAESRCPVAHGRAPHPTQGGGNRGWWPSQLNLRILAKNPAVANPLGDQFDYAKAFNSLDLAAVKRDIADVLTDSQAWW